MAGLDPNVPPHKTRHFWCIVILSVVIAVGYPLAMSSHGTFFRPVWPHVVSSVVYLIIVIVIGWFAVRRAQRAETHNLNLRFFLIALAIILLILVTLFKKHP